MRIGEVARRSGVPATTLRYYEEIGVLPPAERTASGYRDHRDDVLARLAFVRAAQAAGLSLTEIRDVIDLRDRGIAPCSHVAALLDEKAAAVTRQIADLRRLKADLDELRAAAATLDPADCDPRSVCQAVTPASRATTA